MTLIPIHSSYYRYKDKWVFSLLVWFLVWPSGPPQVEALTLVKALLYSLRPLLRCSSFGIWSFDISVKMNQNGFIHSEDLRQRRPPTSHMQGKPMRGPSSRLGNSIDSLRPSPYTSGALILASLGCSLLSPLSSFQLKHRRPCFL
jgi:hypothetical protein